MRRSGIDSVFSSGFGASVDGVFDSSFFCVGGASEGLGSTLSCFISGVGVTLVGAGLASSFFGTAVSLVSAGVFEVVLGSAGLESGFFVSSFLSGVFCSSFIGLDVFDSVGFGSAAFGWVSGALDSGFFDSSFFSVGFCSSFVCFSDDLTSTFVSVVFLTGAASDFLRVSLVSSSLTWFLSMWLAVVWMYECELLETCNLSDSFYQYLEYNMTHLVYLIYFIKQNGASRLFMIKTIN